MPGKLIQANLTEPDVEHFNHAFSSLSLVRLMKSSMLGLGLGYIYKRRLILNLVRDVKDKGRIKTHKYKKISFRLIIHNENITKQLMLNGVCLPKP